MDTYARLLGSALTLLALATPVAAQSPAGSAPPTEPLSARQLDTTYRTGGFERAIREMTTSASLGVLGSTPDDAALALNGTVDYFIDTNVSIGPLLQLGFTEDMALVGLSGQGKYWIDLPNTNGRGRMALQAGFGFVHSNFRNNDTSWLVPLGVSYEHALTAGLDFTTTALVNFTNLDNGAGADAEVMPGIVFGLRF